MKDDGSWFFWLLVFCFMVVIAVGTLAAVKRGATQACVEYGQVTGLNTESFGRIFPSCKVEICDGIWVWQDDRSRETILAYQLCRYRGLEMGGAR